MTNTPNPADAVKITREDFEEACALVESMKPGKSMVDVAARFLAAYRHRLATPTPPAVDDGLVERLREYEGSDALGNGDFSLLYEAADALATKDREIAQAWREGWDAAKTLPLTDDLAQARNEALEEAANACDVSAEGWREAGFYNRSFGADDCATVIRNLKSPAIEGERNND